MINKGGKVEEEIQYMMATRWSMGTVASRLWVFVASFDKPLRETMHG